MKSTPTLLLATVAALSFALPATGQVPPTPAQPSPAAAKRPVSESADMEFVKKAAQAATNEVELGKLASEKASSVEVRAFAAQMVDVHQRVNSELNALVVVPAIPKASPEDTLANLSGPAFDRAYLTKMVATHQAAIDLFEAEERNGRDPAVKTWAIRELPRVRGHWQNARVLHAKAGAATTTTTTTNER